MKEERLQVVETLVRLQIKGIGISIKEFMKHHRRQIKVVIKINDIEIRKFKIHSFVYYTSTLQDETTYWEFSIGGVLTCTLGCLNGRCIFTETLVVSDLNIV